MITEDRLEDYLDIVSFVDYIASLTTPSKMSFNLYQGSTIEAIDRRNNLLYYLKNIIHVHLCKKFLLTLFMSCQSPFAKPYLTLKEAEFDK